MKFSLEKFLDVVLNLSILTTQLEKILISFRDFSVENLSTKIVWKNLIDENCDEKIFEGHFTAENLAGNSFSSGFRDVSDENFAGKIILRYFKALMCCKRNVVFDVLCPNEHCFLQPIFFHHLVF